MDFLQGIVGGFAAVILFIYGVDHLGKEIMLLSHDKLKGILARIAGNKWMGAGMGAITAAIIHSSTATTLIAVSLVNSSIITFTQSLGIIAGANIGSTLTVQLVALNNVLLGPVLIVLGFVLSVPEGRVRILGKSLFYLGMVLFSITLISDAITPFRESSELLAYVPYLNNPLIGLLFGMMVTLLFQSSTITTGIMVLLAQDGFISLPQAVPVVFGANLGSTFTSLLMSLKMDQYAKKAIFASFLFNVLGVLVLLPFMPQYESLITAIGGDSGRMVANAHMFFNVFAALAFLVLSTHIERFISSIIKSDRPELVFSTKYINGMPKSCSEGLELARKELANETGYIRELFKVTVQVLDTKREDDINYVKKLESLTDYVYKRTADYLEMISKMRMSESEAVRISSIARASKEFEQLADLCVDMSMIAAKMKGNGTSLSKSQFGELEPIEALFLENLSILERAFTEISPANLEKAEANKKAIFKLINGAYKRHIVRMHKGESHGGYGEYAGAKFTDIMATIELANQKAMYAMRSLAEAERERNSAKGAK
jgi:phosphate:Na+ symporter